MRYSELKNIDAVMAEKEVLRLQIARKEENFSSRYTKAKAFYTDKSNWFDIIKTILFRKTLLSNPISKLSLGFSIAKYLINRFKR
jgi:hypothetical protein